jgi:hypothetical protein
MAEVQPTRETEAPIFAFQDRVFSTGDIIRAAWFRGELQDPWDELALALECERKAMESELPVDDAIVQTMSEQFRYEHDLITAEETEQWLEDRGMTLEDFSGYFTRRHWAGVLREKVEITPRDYFSAPVECRDLLKVELLLSDRFRVLANRLSWRLAAGALVGNPETPAVEAERTFFFARWKITEVALPGWLAKLGADAAWFEEMLRSEAAFQETRKALLSEETLRDELKVNGQRLTRFDVEILELECADAVREALLCLRDDGLAASTLAEECRYPYRREELYLEDLSDELQRRFLCAAAGDVLEVKRGDCFELCRIEEKAEANLDSEAVRNRLERRILQRHFSELTAKHIRWLVPQTSP